MWRALTDLPQPSSRRSMRTSQGWRCAHRSRTKHAGVRFPHRSLPVCASTSRRAWPSSPRTNGATSGSRGGCAAKPNGPSRS